jgi:hypothetical protein
MTDIWAWIENIKRYLIIGKIDDSINYLCEVCCVPVRDSDVVDVLETSFK